MLSKYASTTAFLPALHSVTPRPTPSESTPPGLWSAAARRRFYYHSIPPVPPVYGLYTPTPRDYRQLPIFKSPFRFDTGFALRARRPPRPFPPPFFSPPSSSFSDPLTTSSESRDKRLYVEKELIRGLNNGNDAIIAAENFIGVNDGVGAWVSRPRGHAALWARLLIHFWAFQAEREIFEIPEPDPVEYLQHSYEETIRATTSPSEWYGTTTSVTALLHSCPDDEGNPQPLLYVTNLGDSKIMVIRPSEEKIIFRTEEQWHWFDCPMQLGTNSIDTPREHAALSKVVLKEDDIVLALSDGVTDNLWEQELLTITLESVRKWEEGLSQDDAFYQDCDGWSSDSDAAMAEEMMAFVARELLKASVLIAEDPFSGSPYMEKAINEGLTFTGGKMDDISIVVGRCKRREG